jgi:hypothetical protein
LRALPGGLTFFRVAGPVEKKPKVGPKQKNTFFAMILTSRPPVNFASNILGLKKTLEAKFYNGLQKNIRNN